MASDVMSLFGMDPNTIQQDRTNKAVSQASAMNPYFAVGAAGGSLMGQGINSAFGLQTADMAQAQGIQDSMDGFDLSTPQGMQQAAQQLMMNGNYAESMALHAKAAAMIKSDTTATNLLEDRSLGKSSNVIVKKAVASLGGMADTPAIQHSITKHADGRFVDATQGKTFDTESDWLDSITELYGKAAADDLSNADAGGTADALLKAVEDGTYTPDQIILGPAPVEVITEQEVQANKDKQQAHEENITMYDAMLPSVKLSPEGVALKAQIDSFQASMDSEGVSDAEFEAERAAQKKQEKYSAELKRYEDQINNLQMKYAAMPQITRGSQQGILISTMLLQAIKDKDNFLASNPQG